MPGNADAPHRFKLLRSVELGGVVVYAFEPQHLGDRILSMRRCTENETREMDLADASRRSLAIETGVTEIMTADTADFSRYPVPIGRGFAIV